MWPRLSKEFSKVARLQSVTHSREYTATCFRENFRIRGCRLMSCFRRSAGLFPRYLPSFHVRAIKRTSSPDRASIALFKFRTLASVDFNPAK
jgi:hypothetical protein